MNDVPTMGPFRGRVLLELTTDRESGRPVYRLLASIGFVEEDGSVVMIAAGAQTDWNSVWRILTPLVPVCDKACLAALQHDDALRRPHLYPPSWQSRRAKDRRFRRTLARFGVAPWRCWAMWLGVRFQAWWTGDRS